MRKQRKKKIPKNTKVKNATPTKYDGIQFKSKLEVYCYTKLKENNIKAVYEEITFEILPSFTYNGEKVRNMKFTPDFVGETFIIECKGNMNDSFPLRWKIFKYYLLNNNLKYNLYLPRNKKQIDQVIDKIIKNK